MTNVLRRGWRPLWPAPALGGGKNISEVLQHGLSCVIFSSCTPAWRELLHSQISKWEPSSFIMSPPGQPGQPGQPSNLLLYRGSVSVSARLLCLLCLPRLLCLRHPRPSQTRLSPALRARQPAGSSIVFSSLDNSGHQLRILSSCSCTCIRVRAQCFVTWKLLSCRVSCIF